MDTKSFFNLLRSLPQLPVIQLERIQEHVRYYLQQDKLHQALSEQTAELPDCPHCHGKKVIHWGNARGLLRYRCKECGRTFNQLHGSALERLHTKTKWTLYAECLVEGLTLRQAAAKCGLNLKTAFRWRHRFLRYAVTTKATRLSGIIEADEVFTRESFKGSRKMTRPARKHGGKEQGNVALVPSLIALDRYGYESDAVLLNKSYEAIEPELEPLLSKGSVLCTDGNQSYIRIAESSVGVIHKRLISSKKHRVEDDVFHIQTLNGYIGRWRIWMLGFHGVGTAYLGNYLAWFRVRELLIDRPESWLTGCAKRIANT